MRAYPYVSIRRNRGAFDTLLNLCWPHYFHDANNIIMGQVREKTCGFIFITKRKKLIKVITRKNTYCDAYTTC